jgi:hypothetical protein
MRTHVNNPDSPKSYLLASLASALESSLSPAALQAPSYAKLAILSHSWLLRCLGIGTNRRNWVELVENRARVILGLYLSN